MRIALYNVNGINGRLPVLLDWLALATPDNVALQELKAPEEQFPEDAIAGAGYDAIWQGQRRWNGLALLSRAGLIHRTRIALPGGSAGDQNRYIEAAIGGMTVASLYLPNGNPRRGPRFDYKLQWFARLERHVASLMAFDAPCRVPAPCDRGWVDAIRPLYPGTRICSFPEMLAQFVRARRGTSDRPSAPRPGCGRDIKSGRRRSPPPRLGEDGRSRPVRIELGRRRRRRSKQTAFQRDGEAGDQQCNSRFQS